MDSSKTVLSLAISICSRNSMGSSNTVLSLALVVSIEKLQNTGIEFSVCITMDFISL